MLKKILSLIFACTVVLPTVLTACSTQISAQEIATRTADAIPKVSSARMDMHSTAVISSTGSASYSLSSTQDMTAEMKNSPQEMHAVIVTSTDMAPLGNIKTTNEIYMVGQWLYASMEMPGTNKTWKKIPLKAENWQSQNQLQLQIELLKNAVTVTKLGTEIVDGVECYVLDIKPDLAAISGFIKSQQPSLPAGGPDLSQLDLNKIIKTYNLKEWVTKDEYLPRKVEMEIAMEMGERDIMPAATSSSTFALTLTSSMKFYDYNKPVSITLPPEALNAPEFTMPAIPSRT